MIEIGQRVKIRRFRDRVPAALVEKVKQNPTGTVKEYKMVDGSGVGVVVQLDASNLATWFFEDELETV